MKSSIKTLAIWVATSTTVEAQVQVHFPTGKQAPSREVIASYLNPKGEYSSYKSEDRKQALMSDIRSIRQQIRNMARRPLVNHQATQKLMEDIAICLQTKPLNNKLSIDMDEIVKL